MAKSMPSGENRILRNGNKGRAQLRPVRQDGWTVRKRAVFLDHVAATGNVSASARFVGLGESGAYKLRRRDPDFAEQWRVALSAGFDRLQAMLIERAMGPLTVQIGDTPMPDVSTMDTELAMRLVEHHRRTIAGAPQRRGGPVPTRATEEETNAALLKRLKILHKRNQKEAADVQDCNDSSDDAATEPEPKGKE